MSSIETKYARIVGSRLDKFKEKKPDLYNFRCPYCGDSKKHKSKARGYLFAKGQDLIFKCHNCGVGQSLGNFINRVNAKDVNKLQLEGLVKAGVFDEFDTDRNKILNSILSVLLLLLNIVLKYFSIF